MYVEMKAWKGKYESYDDKRNTRMPTYVRTYVHPTFVYKKLQKLMNG